jgi:short subunit fatty acids transporter
MFEEVYHTMFKYIACHYTEMLEAALLVALLGMAAVIMVWGE